MCGIVGIFDPGSKTLDKDIIAMRDLITYRGPDGAGSMVFPEVGLALGHRRLSILDLSDAGAQPMQYAGGALTIVYNGEVYNYRELRTELEQGGYRFRSNTDTEVVLAAYDCWGKDCLRRFNGMFAFAIWDSRSRHLFLARDRLGIKPLYYYHDGYRFIFASEIKSILAVLPDKPSIHSALIDEYMTFGYLPGERTLFEGIYRLLPGNLLVYEKGKIGKEQFWDFQFDNDRDLGLTYYLEKFSFLINDAIDLRLRSDVPLGIFLSGGLDSSAVVALLAPRVAEPLKTFSVAYDFGSDFNETSYARLVAKQFNTDHHEFFVKPIEFLDFVPDYVWYMDEPVTESAAISLYFIAKLAKEYVTVVLSGEGSDEIFAGYDFYFYNKLIENYRSLIGSSLANRIGSALSSCLPMNKLGKYLRLSSMSLEERYRGISTYDDHIKRSLYSSGFQEFIDRGHQNDGFLNSLFTQTTGRDALSRMLYFDTRTWLVDDLLIKADRMSMAASLELRVPFLDYRLVEFAASVPSKYKFHGRTPKYLLKKLMENKLPREIIHRKKLGFPTPLKMMFQGDLYEYACDLLLSASFCNRGYFQSDRIEKLLNEHKQNKNDHHRLIWQLVVLEEWHRRFAD